MGLTLKPSDRGPRSDINVTPLVDVVLVLLIIFMVATPTVLRELGANVPRKAPSGQAPPVDTLTVSLSSGVIELNHQPMTESQLLTRLRSLLEDRRDKVVFFEIDDDAEYGLAVRLMDVVKGAGAKTLAISTP